MLKIYFKYYIPGITWALIILVLCLLPGNNFPEVGFWDFLPVDKIVHVFLYSILGVLIFWASEKSKKQSILLNSTLVLVVCILYGLLIEIFQEYFTTTRHAETIDIFADLLGGIIACIGYICYKKYFGIKIE